MQSNFNKNIMLQKILAIAGRPGLYRFVSQGKNMIIVESLADGRRFPASARDRVSGLADITIYTTDGDRPLPEVFELVGEKTGLKPVDMAALKQDADLRAYFGEILPDFDRDRVYSTDIRKLFNWYNALLAAGITEFVDKKEAEEEKEEKDEKAEEA